MPESHVNKLAKIDDHLQLLNEERLALINNLRGQGKGSFLGWVYFAY